MAHSYRQGIAILRLGLPRHGQPRQGVGIAVRRTRPVADLQVEQGQLRRPPMFSCTQTSGLQVAERVVVGEHRAPVSQKVFPKLLRHCPLEPQQL